MTTPDTRSPTPSRVVLRVDADVVVGEVAGPEASVGVPLGEFEGGCDLGLLHGGDGGGAVEWQRLAGADELDVADPERGVGRIEADASAAGSHHQAAPVRVVAEEGGLHQRRVRYRHGDPAGVGSGAGAADVDLDQLGGALTVAGQGAGELGADLLE